jgi:hypothetical protein
MKPSSKLYYTLPIVLLFFSCKKDNISDKLIGRWQIQQVYYGYTNGGDFRWHTTREEDKSILTFRADGSYNQNVLNLGTLYECSGTYFFLNDSELTMNLGCYTTPYNIKIYVSEKTLIITHRVIEGEIKEKFIKLE